MKLSRKTITFSAVAAIAIIGLVGFLYYRSNAVSKQILKLEILGPDHAAMGEEIEYTIKYKNNGNFTLENPKLTFLLPDHSLTEDGKMRLTQTLKDIYPGQESFVAFKTRLLGKEGDIKTASASLSYVPHNLSVRYESDTTFITKIDATPITLTYDMPSKVEKGKEITYSINYFSNVDYPLEDMSIKIDQVSGFTFKSSDPVSLDQNEYKLATLQKNQGGRITIKGIVSADTGSTLNFKARLGMWVNGTFVVVKEVNQDLQIIQPQLSIAQQINNSSNYVASASETLHYQISVTNTGTTQFDNVFLISKLEGSAFDMSSIKSFQGQVHIQNNTIIFDAKKIPALQHLLPNQQVELDFSVVLKNTISDAQNSVLKNTVTAFDVTQEFTTKINSQIQISQQASYEAQNDIVNSGPVPPQVNMQTSYTITWNVKNGANDTKNVKVRAVLPQNVTINDAIYPDDQAANFSVDSKSREVVWLVGDITANSQKTLSFQISLTPSFLQKGSVAALIGQAIVSGEDQFTGGVTQNTSAALTTGSVGDQTSFSGIVQ